MHPTTAVSHGWKRTFNEGDKSVELQAHCHSLHLVLAVFQRHGFELIDLLEPCFGELERELFVAAGRASDFQSLTVVPAIYIARFRRVSIRPKFAVSGTTLNLLGARYGLGPLEWSTGPISIQDGRIARLTSRATSYDDALDLSGYVLLPGLVNAHDHLEFALYPNLGRPADVPPYANASEWAEEIHCKHADRIALHRAVPREACLWWGAIRNLLSGVTSVCHHNEIYPLVRDPSFPVRVVTQFGWAHSLALDSAVVERHKATAAGRPFVVHAGEGIDRASAEEVSELDHIGVLSECTLLVHGLALSKEGVDLMNKRSSGLITCPTSNAFLFHKLPTAPLLSSVQKVALGSDSPLTAAGDLLDEIRCLYREVGLHPRTIYEMVTTQAADLLRLDLGEGRIFPNSIADLIAVVDRQGTPAAVLADTGWEQVELVIVGGRVQMASDALYARLSEDRRQGLARIVVEGIGRWLRAPVTELIRVTSEVLGAGNIRVGGKRVSHASAL